MAYIYELPNATGIDTTLVQTISSVPAFTPLLLVFIFFVILLGGSARQKAKTGNADFPMWSVVASMSTLMIALLMSTITGIIQLDWLIIVTVITILSGLWLFMSHRQSEV